MKIVRLGDIAKIVSGSTAPKDSQFGDEGIPFIRAGHLKELCNGLQLKSLPKIEECLIKGMVRVPKDTVVFAKSGMSCMKGRIYNTTDEAYIVNHLAGVICTDVIMPNYLKYYFKYFQPNKLVLDDSYPSIRLNDISDLMISLPEIELQNKIADILDKAQELIDKRKEQIEACDELIKGLFYHTASDVCKEEYELIELITGIEAGWSVGGEERRLEEGEIGVLKISAVTKGVFNDIEYKVIDKSIVIKKAVKCRKGDILFSRANTREMVGASCIVPKDFNNLIIPDKLWKISVDINKANPRYFQYILSLPETRSEISNVATGSSGSMLNISMDKLKKIKINLVELNYQNKFIKDLEKIEQQKSLMQQSLTQLENNFNSLMQRAFKGELF